MVIVKVYILKGGEGLKNHPGLKKGPLEEQLQGPAYIVINNHVFLVRSIFLTLRHYFFAIVEGLGCGAYRIVKNELLSLHIYFPSTFSEDRFFKINPPSAVVLSW